jgi:hypothetical protein
MKLLAGLPEWESRVATANHSQMSVNYPIVIGNRSSFEKRYGGIVFLPMTYFPDREGKVIGQELGKQPQRLRGAHKKVPGSGSGRAKSEITTDHS